MLTTVKRQDESLYRFAQLNFGEVSTTEFIRLWREEAEKTMLIDLDSWIALDTALSQLLAHHATYSDSMKSQDLSAFALVSTRLHAALRASSAHFAETLPPENGARAALLNGLAERGYLD